MVQRSLLPQHNRYDFIPLPERRDYSWPGGKRLAFCVTTNVEWFAFGAGLGHDPAKTGEPQTHRNYAWRDYGNRVGIWRLLELFDELKVPAAHNPNTLDLLKELGYRYVMDWPMDDQPVWLRTRAGPLLSIPYPVELNDSQAVIHRRSGA